MGVESLSSFSHTRLKSDMQFVGPDVNLTSEHSASFKTFKKLKRCPRKHYFILFFCVCFVISEAPIHSEELCYKNIKFETVTARVALINRDIIVSLPHCFYLNISQLLWVLS